MYETDFVVAVRKMERVICQHPAVEDAVVIPLHTPEGAPKVKAFIELGDTDTQPDSIIRYYEEKYQGVKMPLEIVFKDIPRTASGKVIRQQLLCS